MCQEVFQIPQLLNANSEGRLFFLLLSFFQIDRPIVTAMVYLTPTTSIPSSYLCISAALIKKHWIKFSLSFSFIVVNKMCTFLKFS